MSEIMLNISQAPSFFSRWHRALVVLVLGFASGIPLALTAGAMQAWLTIENIDLATIGFLSLVGVPYTFKFLWAPLMDRFEPPWFGRRRGWIIITQLALAVLLYFFSKQAPQNGLQVFGMLAVLVALTSASQDIVIDAYRSDLLPLPERGLGASLSVLGYRLGMVISGGIALIWAQQWQSWPRVYEVMALLMVVAAIFSAIALPKVSSEIKPLASEAGTELMGFLSMLLGVAAGCALGHYLLVFMGLDASSEDKWVRLAFIMAQMLFALILGLVMSRGKHKVLSPYLIFPIAAVMGFVTAHFLLDALQLGLSPTLNLVSKALFATMVTAVVLRTEGFVTLNQSLDSYFSNKSAWTFLIMIVLYKVGDAFAMSLTTPFMIRGLGFTQDEVGLANKTIGLLATIAGALLGGLIMLRVRLSHALIGFGVLQLLSNLGYYWLAVSSKGAWGTIEIPAFNLLIAKLKEDTTMDTLMLSVIGVDNLSGGMGTAALVALLMSLCNKKFSATHFALLSAFASLGRVFIGPFSGVLAEQIGWPKFFMASLVVAAPGVLLLFMLRHQIEAITASEPKKSPI
jgi:MFS transporter, PAT family, beta-lactamase induction signal transducer AmpG